MRKNNPLDKLLIETSTSDGATLWLVLTNLSGNGTIDDLLVEIRNEMELFHLILGAKPTDLPNYRLFVNRGPALDLAQSRLSGGGDQDAGMSDGMDQSPDLM